MTAPTMRPTAKHPTESGRHYEYWAPHHPVASTGWTGWVSFAGVILIINGVFSGLQGLVALTGPDTYYMATQGTLFLFDAKGWGWWNLAHSGCC